MNLTTYGPPKYLGNMRKVFSQIVQRKNKKILTAQEFAIYSSPIEKSSKGNIPNLNSLNTLLGDTFTNTKKHQNIR